MRAVDPRGSPASQGRRSTVQMRAVEAPRSSGSMLDESLSFDMDIDIDAGGALELDCLPSSHGTRVEQPRQMSHEPPPVSRPTPRPMAQTMASRWIAPPPSEPRSGPGSSSSAHKAVDAHAAFVAFAGFGDPPSGILGTPGYALRVILRRRALRSDLALARRRRSPDVGLYEASLRMADKGALRTGMALWAIMVVLCVVVVGAVLHGVPRLSPG